MSTSGSGTTGPGAAAGGLRGYPSTPARRRLLLWLAGTAVIVVVGSLLVVVQVRAGRAAEARAATQRSADAVAGQVARSASDEAAVRAEAAAIAARASLAAERAAAVAAVTAQVAGAEPVLAASLGQVADDSVRQLLAAAIEAAHAAVGAAMGTASAVGTSMPSAVEVAATGMAVDSARATVEAAQAAWQRAAAAAAAEAASTRSGTVKRQTSAAPTADVAAAAAAAKSKAAAGSVPVWVTSVPTADGDGSNGHMPMSSMCLIPWGTDQIGSPQYLRCDALSALTPLADAFRAQFGDPLALDLTYRSFAEQVAVAAYYGSLAATPGESRHGLGIALDVQEWPTVYGFGTERYQWLVAHAPEYGWFAPATVRQTGPYPEYWHYEYGPGRTS